MEEKNRSKNAEEFAKEVQRLAENGQIEAFQSLFILGVVTNCLNWLRN